MGERKVTTIYVDESIHEQLGFVITSFVCSNSDLQTAIEKDLLSLGFSLGVDEFKSGEYMASNPRMRGVRARLLDIAGSKAKIAILVTGATRRKSLGTDIICGLEKVVRKNGLNTTELKIFFDKGLFHSAEEGDRLAGEAKILAPSKLFFEQDSKVVFGIQVTDAVAHTVAQILREEITGEVKFIPLGQEAGYAEGTKAELGWVLLMNLRYAFFVRPVVVQAKAHKLNPEVDPIVLSEEEDLVDRSIHPDLFGWGVFIGSDLQPEICTAVRSVFDKIWLGCIH